MDIINILPDSVANQIAAGEVVDRPAGAVKELVENAMDAGASQIDLVVKDAGRTLIQVIDNGCGMSDADARLCFERHATSKIQKADDLFAIHTMGFRGEALASIAAIAQVELRTRQIGAELGTEITIEGSHIKDQHPTACPPGTSMAVKSLFFNVPARRNFLKKDSVELSHIEEVFRRITLVHYDIGFTFTHNGKLLYDLKAGSMLQRISGLYNHLKAEQLYSVEEQTDLVRIKGFVGKPECSRRSRGEQYLFVNGRYIKHLGLGSAVERAYSDLLPERTYPSYFISLTVDPSRIDVNIHPTKTEVRFADEHALFSILHAAVKKALGQFTLANQLDFDRPAEFDFSPAPRGFQPDAPRERFNPNYNPFHQHQATQTSLRFQAPVSTPDHSTPTPLSIPASAPLPSAPSPIPTPNTFLQVQNRFVVTTLASGLAIIDQQRASERIIYDRLINQAANPTPQSLLFPINCRFSPADAELLTELLPDIKAYGFEVEPLSACEFVVTATPPDLNSSDPQQLFDSLLTDYKSSTLQKYTARSQALCVSMARQMAIRNGQPLSPETMQQLVADLFACPMADTSPSGKKIITIVKPDTLF